MSLYRVGLIGLGQIAQGYGTPEEKAPYCHAGGLAQSKKVQLVAVADPFEAAYQGFQSKWGATFEAGAGTPKSYLDAGQMLAEANLDIVGVCVRGPMHYTVVRQILESAKPPRAIFLEKPPFCSLAEADEIIKLAQEIGVILVVSYSRHWAPHVLKLEELVRDGLIGEVRNVVGYCGGTFLSFASHTTDLICQFACAQSASYEPHFVTARGELIDQSSVPADFTAKNYEVEPVLRGLTINFANGVTGTQIGQDGDHGAFYADVFGEKGRVRAGIYIPPAAFDADNKPIDLTPFDFPEETSVFHRAYDQIADYFDGGPLPDCSEHNWQQVNEIGFAAIESLHSASRVELPNANRNRLIFANG